MIKDFPKEFQVYNVRGNRCSFVKKFDPFGQGLIQYLFVILDEGKSNGLLHSLDEQELKQIKQDI